MERGHKGILCKVALLDVIQNLGTDIQTTCWSRTDNLQCGSFKKKITRRLQCRDNECPRTHRLLTCVIFRFRLNALRTKFSKSVTCICGSDLTPSHVLFYCQPLKPFLPSSFRSQSPPSSEDVLNDNALMVNVVQGLLKSPVGPLL